MIINQGPIQAYSFFHNKVIYFSVQQYKIQLLIALFAAAIIPAKLDNIFNAKINMYMSVG